MTGFQQGKRPPQLSQKQWRQLPGRAYEARLLLQAWKAARANPKTPADVLEDFQAGIQLLLPPGCSSNITYTES
jgi:hypothetical protein